MAEPKKRLTSARTGARRSHLRKRKISLNVCPKCHSPRRPHYVCPTCGFYKETDVLHLEEKAKKKEERLKAREAEEKEAMEKK